MLNPGSSEQRLQQIIAVQSAMVQAELDLDGFMQRVVDTVQELTAAKGAVVELVDGDEMIYRSVSQNLRAHAGLRLPRAGSLSGLSVSEAAVLRCDDSETDPRVDVDACRKVGVRSMVCAPLFRSGRAVGVLKIMSDRVNGFSDGDTQALTLLAGMLGAELGKQLAFDSLQQTETRLRLLLEYANAAIITIDENAIVLRWNHAAEQMFHCLAAAAIGQSLHDLQSARGVALQLAPLFLPYLNGVAPLLATAMPDTELNDGIGGRRVVEYHISDHRFGRARELTAFLTDITARRELEQALRDMAQTDALTGLANRRHFLEQLGKAVARLHRQATGLALFYLDMNEFKAINDRHGHDFGDQVLCEFSRRLQQSVRETDTVGRLGGDEFVVLAEGITNADQALTLAEKIATALAEPMPGCTFRLHASIGVRLAQTGDDAEQLLTAADVAMYQAKRNKTPQRSTIALSPGTVSPGTVAITS